MGTDTGCARDSARARPAHAGGTGSATPAAGARPSLRRRLALAFALLALGVALGQAALLYWTTEHAEEALIDRILEEQLQRSAALYRTQPQYAFPNTGDMTLYVIAPGEVAGLPPWLRALPQQTGRHELHPETNLEVHVAVLRERERVFYLVYDVAEHEQRRRDTAALLALSVLAAGAFGLLVAGGLARRLLGDLERLAGAVRERAGAPAARTDADSRLAPLASHAETSTLAQALDDEHARAAQALARERAFAAAANHELRTPLMQASSTLELLDAKLEDPAQRTLLRRLQDAHADLRALTDALLRVARGHAREAVAPCALHDVVAGVLARAADDASARGIVVTNTVPREMRLPVDAGSLAIVLQNLVINAIRHSGARRVTVGAADAVLTVDDDGRGFMQRALDGRSGSGAHGEFEPVGGVAGHVRGPHGDTVVDEGAGTDRDASPAAGSGLGLAIVDRVCDANAWRWSIGPGPAGGTRAALVLATQDGGGTMPH